MTKLFVIEDDKMCAMTIRHKLKDIEGLEIHHFENGFEALRNLTLEPSIVIIDFELPDMNGLELMENFRIADSNVKVILYSGQSDPAIVVQAYKSGANHYVVKGPDSWGELVNSVGTLLKTVNRNGETRSLAEEVVNREKYGDIVGNSPETLRVLRLIQKVETREILVMVTGESGTGKELVARAIHDHSLRRKGPFVAVNMAAIPEDLFEVELFGHEKGAFTGASGKRIGKFEQALKGTIFLDEIGEIDLQGQSKLLRVLEERTIQRIGSNKTISLDVRIVAATNRNLWSEVKAGRFREDLYFRLQGFIINLPPLRERGDDKLLLAQNFANTFAMKNKISAIAIAEDALSKIKDYDWPGNVRELKATIERACIMSGNASIKAGDLLLATTAY